jgi:hypothetical protein
MLHELSSVRQIPGDFFRRIFIDQEFDLYVWLKPDGSIHGFQLCYDTQEESRALTWIEQRGFSHNSVDSGEDDPLANRTPILRPCGSFDAEQVLPLYLAVDLHLPADIRDYIRQKLETYERKS